MIILVLETDHFTLDFAILVESIDDVLVLYISAEAHNAYIGIISTWWMTGNVFIAAVKAVRDEIFS